MLKIAVPVWMILGTTFAGIAIMTVLGRAIARGA